jgi:LysM repeat protein
MGDTDALVDGDVRPPRRGRGRTLLTVLLAVGFIALAGLGGYAAALMVSRSAAAPTPSTMLPTATATATVAVTRSPATSPSATAAASRTPTPSRTPVASPSSEAPASPGSTPTIHTVAPGETLTAIARRYGVTVAAIVEANDLANPNSISVGQKLTIPPKP